MRSYKTPLSVRILCAVVLALCVVAVDGRAAEAVRRRSRRPVATIAPGNYVVKRGDTVSRIARRARTTIAALAAANGLGPPYRIRIGQTLRVPGAAAAAPAPRAPARSGGSGTHVVVAGDTLSRVARRYGTSVAALAAANGLGSPYLIRVGQTLRLGGAAPAPAPRPAPAPARPAPVPSVGAILQHWAGVYGIPADLAKAVAWIESGWRAGARSPKGAMGVMQLMPGTARWIQDQLLHQAIDPWNPDHNVRAGLAYLRWLLNQWRGDVRLALASYFQGIGSVRRSGVYVVSEAYVRKVQSARARF